MRSAQDLPSRSRFDYGLSSGQAVQIADLLSVNVEPKGSMNAMLTVSGTTGGFSIQTFKHHCEYAVEVIEELRVAAATASAHRRIADCRIGGPG